MARSPGGEPTLFIIGGAEDRVGQAVVLRRFVRLAGGRRSRIVIIPTASSFQDEVVAAYRDVFTRLARQRRLGRPPGAPRVDAHDPTAGRADRRGHRGLHERRQPAQAEPATSSAPRSARRIHRAHDRGAVVAGTSAGASIMSQFMISMGDEGITPRQRTSQLTAGLGLLEGVIIDQHFDQRARYGRLMSMVAASPNLLGIGIDEDTAVEVHDRSTV